MLFKKNAVAFAGLMGLTSALAIAIPAELEERALVCPDITRVVIGTYVVPYSIVINQFFQFNQVINVGGVTININNAPTQVLTTVMATSTVTSTSTVTVGPSTVPTPFILGIGAPGAKAKRQGPIAGIFIGAGGVITSDCRSAVVWRLTAGQLTSNGQFVSTNQGAVSKGFSVSAGIGDITTSFSAPNDKLIWANSLFANGLAQFCSTGGSIIAKFLADANICSAVGLNVIPASGCPAASSSSSSTTASVTTSVTSTTTGVSSSTSQTTGGSPTTTPSPAVSSTTITTTTSSVASTTTTSTTSATSTATTTTTTGTTTTTTTTTTTSATCSVVASLSGGLNGVVTSITGTLSGLSNAGLVAALTGGVGTAATGPLSGLVTDLSNVASCALALTGGIEMCVTGGSTLDLLSCILGKIKTAGTAVTSVTTLLNNALAGTPLQTTVNAALVTAGGLTACTPAVTNAASTTLAGLTSSSNILSLVTSSDLLAVGTPSTGLSAITSALSTLATCGVAPATPALEVCTSTVNTANPLATVTCLLQGVTATLTGSQITTAVGSILGNGLVQALTGTATLGSSPAIMLFVSGLGL